MATTTAAAAAATSKSFAAYRTKRKKFEKIAQFLLDEGLLLSALELHQELLETTGDSLGNLLERFSSFDESLAIDMPLPSLAPIDPDVKGMGSRKQSSNDLTKAAKLSVMEQQLTERNAKLEQDLALARHDLRAAREDLASLQVELHQQQEPQGQMHSTTLSTGQMKDVKVLMDQDPVMSPFEQKVLCYMIYQYLVSIGMKVTAITFSEEMGCELENWGQLIGPRLSSKHKPPPKLLAFYRYFYNVGPNKELSDLQKRLDLAEEMLVREQAQLAEQKTKNAEILERLQVLQEEMLLLDRGKKLKMAMASAVDDPQDLLRGRPSRDDLSALLSPDAHDMDHSNGMHLLLLFVSF